MKKYLTTLAALMNDNWYLECRTPERQEAGQDRFISTLACVMNDESYLHCADKTIEPDLRLDQALTTAENTLAQQRAHPEQSEQYALSGD